MQNVALLRAMGTPRIPKSVPSLRLFSVVQGTLSDVNIHVCSSSSKRTCLHAGTWACHSSFSHGGDERLARRNDEPMNGAWRRKERNKRGPHQLHATRLLQHHSEKSPRLCVRHRLVYVCNTTTNLWPLAGLGPFNVMASSKASRNYKAKIPYGTHKSTASWNITPHVSSPDNVNIAFSSYSGMSHWRRNRLKAQVGSTGVTRALFIAINLDPDRIFWSR